MPFLSIVKSSERQGPPPQALMDAMDKFVSESLRNGSVIQTGGLGPSSKGARFRVSKGKLTVTDGPFTESKELISYALYEVRSKEEAVEWASRFIKLHRDHWAGWTGSTDILQVMDSAGGPPAE